MSGRAVHFVLLIAGFFLSMIGSALGAQAPANSGSGPKTTALINWLSELSTRSGHKVVSGQYVGPNYGRPESGFATLQDCYDADVGNLATATGEYVGLVGFTPTNRPLAGGGSASDNMPDFTNIKPIALSYANAGGIVAITFIPSNPFTGENCLNSTVPAGHTLGEIITPGTAANTQYMIWLSAFADGLQYFEDNGIPLIVRPFAEMNGGWFWWGTTSTSSASDYIAVWQHCFNYLTVTRGLGNLLFSWAPDCNQSLSAATARYPGNAYVDIIGWSRYANTYTASNFYTTFNSATYGKTLMYAEVGKTAGTFNDPQIMTEIKTNFQNLTGYQFWMKTPTLDLSMIAGTNASALLSDAWTINRGGVMKGGEFDDPSASITYSGTWNHVTGQTGFYLGTEAAANTTGAYAELTFMGTGIQVMVKKDTGLGKFDVYIDNMTTPVATNIDTYSSSTLFQQIVYSNLSLASGTHKIRIKLNGQKNPSSTGYWIGLDGFISQ